MNAQTQAKQIAVCNLIIFVVAINLLGWLGWLLAQDGTAESIGLGTLVWLGSPLFATSSGCLHISKYTIFLPMAILGMTVAGIISGC